MALKPDPSKFDDPHQWATWIAHRTPQYKTHKTLGVAKTACAGRFGYGRSAGDSAVCDMYVYEWNNESLTWEERYFIPAKTAKKDAPLFQQVVRKKGGVAEPSEKAVSAAIASIMGHG